MKIVAVNRFYWPDHSATAQILTDLLEHLAEENRAVCVITSRLGYDDPSQRLAKKELRAGVHVIRVWTSRFGRNWLPARAIDYLTFYVSAFIAMVWILRKGDVLIAKTDPPMISVIALVAAKIKRAKLVNWLQDLFPEIAAALGVRIASGLPGRGLTALRNLSLRNAHMNVAIADSMAARIGKFGVPQTCRVVIENWCDPGVQPVDLRENALRQAWGLGETFVIGYSGNLGRAHLPNKVAELVSRTADIEDLTWLFIGGGAGLALLKEQLGEQDAVDFKPYQPRAALSESLSAPDAHLIALDPTCESLIMPSKLYGVLAVNRPIIFLGDPAGAIPRRLRDESGAHLILDAAAPDRWRDAVGDFVAAHRCGSGSRCSGSARATVRSRSLAAWSSVLSATQAGDAHDASTARMAARSGPAA